MAGEVSTVTWTCDRSKFLEVISCKNKYEENLGIISGFTWYLEIKPRRISRQHEVKIEKSKDEPDGSSADDSKVVNYFNYLWDFNLSRDKDHLAIDVSIKLLFGTNVMSDKLTLFKGLMSLHIGFCDTTNLSDYRMDLFLTFEECKEVNLSDGTNGVDLPESSSSDNSSPDKISNYIKLSDDLLDLLKTGRESDVTLKCGSTTFKAHKLILSARSSKFRKKFETPEEDDDFVFVQSSEDGTSEYLIKHTEPVVVRYFLEYLYSGCTSIPSHDMVCDLQKLAANYEVTLNEEICNFLNQEDAKTYKR